MRHEQVLEGLDQHRPLDARRGGGAVVLAAKTGRPTKFSAEVANKICDRLAQDEGLETICRDKHMPGVTTVYRWRRENDDFRQAYARAREDQGHTVADGLGDIRRKLLRGELDAATATAAANIAKWEASRRASKDYGDRVDHTSSDGSMAPQPVIYQLPDNGRDDTA